MYVCSYVCNVCMFCFICARVMRERLYDMFLYVFMCLYVCMFVLCLCNVTMFLCVYGKCVHECMCMYGMCVYEYMCMHISVYMACV